MRAASEPTAFLGPLPALPSHLSPTMGEDVIAQPSPGPISRGCIPSTNYLNHSIPSSAGKTPGVLLTPGGMFQGENTPVLTQPEMGFNRRFSFQMLFA